MKTHFSENPSTSHVILATAWLLVSSDGVRQIKVRALLDQGSTHSLISQTVVNALKCKTHSVNARLSGIGDVSIGRVTEIATLVISSIHEPETPFQSDALVVKTLTSYIPRFRYPISHWPYLEGLALADEDPTSEIPIQIIIGADLYPYILREGLRKGSLGQPVGQYTAFGWILSGCTGASMIQQSNIVHAHFIGPTEDLDNLLRRFWEIEDIPENIRMSAEDSQCEQFFADTVSRDESGRYIVRIPFISSTPLIECCSTLSKKSPLLCLNPFLDEDRLLRVGGRLNHSDLPFCQKHPLVLKGCHVARIIVRWAHAKCLHGGLSLTLSTIRSEFWILQAQKIVKSVLFHCIACAKIRVDLGRQLMSSMPSARHQRPQRAFLHCGVDYAGPLSVRMAGGRGIKSRPAYIALFVCLATKALHLEIVSHYSTYTFISAYHRFCSRRGLPSDMYSDCSTTFQGADRELKQAFRSAIVNPKFKALLAHDTVSWHFIPPAAPHFGGLWDAGVKSMKSHLKKVLLGKTPTYKELNTLVSHIEACLNSRPLSPLSNRIDDLDALTPAHFLIGAPTIAILTPTVLDTSVSCISRWLVMQQTFELFWKRW